MRWGASLALVALTAVVVALGPALSFVPIDALRLVVGIILLIFGLQWLRKAILRASGLEHLHDEDEIYRDQLAASNRAGHRSWHGLDWYSFTISLRCSSKDSRWSSSC